MTRKCQKVPKRVFLTPDSPFWVGSESPYLLEDTECPFAFLARKSSIMTLSDLETLLLDPKEDIPATSGRFWPIPC